MNAPSTTDNLLANQLGTNSNQRFQAVVQNVDVTPDKGCFLRINLAEYNEAEMVECIREGDIAVGFGFQNGFTVDAKALRPMVGLALAYAIFDLYFAVGEIVVNIPVTPADIKFIDETLLAITSWNRHLSGMVPAEICWQNIVGMDEDIQVHQLDYNKVVLGASGGKESTLNKILLDKAGYQVEEVTFTKSHHENEPNSSLYLHWIPDEDASWIMIPHLNPLPGTAFDAQGALGVPLYGLLAFVASQKKAGVLAVGTEFGMSKIWYPTDPTSGVTHEVHDFSVDEGLFVCEQLEKYLAAYGLPVHIISPVGPLHEMGILRALHRVDPTAIGKLDSCWLAKNLQTHYCGQCFKCQRIRQYMDMLHAKHPGWGFDQILKFENLRVATGSMLSYSVQYNLTEDFPELPWDTALIVDETSMKFLDYRTGNRILKVLVNELGFTDTIYPGLIDQKFEPKVLSAKEFEKRVIDYLGVDYCQLSIDMPRINEHVWFWLPYEEAMLLQIAHTDKVVPEGWINAPLMSRVHRVPVYRKSEDKWYWLRFKPVGPDGDIDLKLPTAAYELDIFKLWLGEDTLMAGINFLKVQCLGIEEEVCK
jgi:hypothetical protein